jgi:hypothetical protein
VVNFGRRFHPEPGQNCTPVHNPDAQLAAGLLLATWTEAFIQGHRTFRQKRNSKKANAAFLTIVDKGTVGTKAAMAGTRYA